MRFVHTCWSLAVSEDGGHQRPTHDLNTVDAVRGQSQDIIDSPPNINSFEIVGIGRARIPSQGLGEVKYRVLPEANTDRNEPPRRAPCLESF